MTLDQLRVFVAVAERQHVTRAAQALNLAQSAASVANEKALDNLLYGVANLRKRGYQNDEEPGDVEAGPSGGTRDEIEDPTNDAD